jgi:hypothetical protein
MAHKINQLHPFIERIYYHNEGGYQWSTLLVDNLFNVANLGHMEEITKKKVLEIVLCVEDTVLYSDQRKIKYQENLDKNRATDLTHRGMMTMSDLSMTTYIQLNEDMIIRAKIHYYS